jgi:predicted phage terminase large subunit-like protein
MSILVSSPMPSASLREKFLMKAWRQFEKTVLLNPWVPHEPHPKQQLFLLHEDWREGLYGGAAGGAKSDSLLIAAAQYVNVPGYAALLVRRTFRDLNQPDALIPRSKEWWLGKVPWNNMEKRWTFPSGATITFGYLEHADDIYQYMGAAFQFIGVDELTQFEEGQYTYLASRLRKPVHGALAEVPLRLRAGSNPGGVGHDWVKLRFLPAEFFQAPEEDRFVRPWYKNRRFFIPARLEDNPTLNLEQYERSLALLDPVTRAQLRSGDWKAHAGGRFNPRWFRRYKKGPDFYQLDNGLVIPMADCTNFTTLDPANRKTKASKFTAIGTFAAAGEQRVLVLDMFRDKLSLEEIIPALSRVAHRWDPLWVGIEANGFQIALVREARQIQGMPTVYEMDPEGKSKLTRATPAILRAEHGLLFLPEEAPWLDDFEGEVTRFTGDETLDSYTDQVDVLAYAVLGLNRYGTMEDGVPFVFHRNRPPYPPRS